LVCLRHCVALVEQVDRDIAIPLYCLIDGSGGGACWPADPELVEMYWRDRREQAALTESKEPK
jgi:hypothetical protein